MSFALSPEIMPERRSGKKNKKTFAQFYEPDLDDELTAVACIDTGEIFKNLELA